MFTVAFRYGNLTPKECICDINSLFFLCTILESNPNVLNFKVTQQASVIFPSNFGWGPFSKWVEKLYSLREES